MLRWLPLVLLLLAGCERPCAAGPVETCAPLELTCDVARGACVVPADCTSNADCPDHFSCRTGMGPEGVVQHGVIGCVRNCMVFNEGEKPDSLCDVGFVCNATTKTCELGASLGCRVGSSDTCHGGNCGPEGKCVAPRLCSQHADCPGGALCESSTGTCYESCAVTLQCKSTSTCDTSAHLCTP